MWVFFIGVESLWGRRVAISRFAVIRSVGNVANKTTTVKSGELTSRFFFYVQASKMALLWLMESICRIQDGF